MRCQQELVATHPDGGRLHSYLTKLSVGFVVADGQNALADLMSDADLCVYEDKANRSQAREQREASALD